MPTGVLPEPLMVRSRIVTNSVRVLRAATLTAASASTLIRDDRALSPMIFRPDDTSNGCPFVEYVVSFDSVTMPPSPVLRAAVMASLILLNQSADTASRFHAGPSGPCASDSPTAPAYSPGSTRATRVSTPFDA